MKPKRAPASLEWHNLPTFDDLKMQSGLKVALLRTRLADVPCWRCEDNSVRYDAAGAEAAIADCFNDALKDAAKAESEGDEPTLLGMLDKQIQINATAARQHNETLKAMGEPLRCGVELWKVAWDRQETRLSKLEGHFDRMLAVLEQGLSAQHERELAVKKHEANVQFRGQTLSVVKTQLPKMVDKWALTGKANAAVRLVDSLEPEMVETLLSLGVLSDEQRALLQQLRGTSMPAAAAEASTTTTEQAEGTAA